MNIHEAQMYVNLAAACKRRGNELNNDTVEALRKMSIERHCGNGYWSIDGLLDDLTTLTGDEELASTILNEAA